MNSLYILGYQFNGLEFVTYILLPVSVVLILLIYVFFNIKLIKDTFNLNLIILDDFDEKNKKYLEKIKKKLDNDDEYFSEDLLILEKTSKKSNYKEKL